MNHLKLNTKNNIFSVFQKVSLFKGGCYYLSLIKIIVLECPLNKPSRY